MRQKSKRLSISMVMLLVGTGAFAQTGTDDAEQVVREFLVPFGRGEIPGFTEFFADDATVFLPPSAPGAPTGRIEGKRAIAAEFAAVSKRANRPAGSPRTPVNPQDLSVQRLGDVAIVTFHLGTESARNRRTFVLRRTGSVWKIVHLHASEFTMR